VDADFHEMSAEGRLLVFFVEVTVFHRVFRGDAVRTRGFGERCAAITCSHLAIRKNRLRQIKAELLRHCFTQLDAGGVNAGGRTVAAPLPAGTARNGETRVAEPNDHLVECDAHHLSGSLSNDRIAARADIGHVSLDRDGAAIIDSDARGGFHQQIVAKGSGDARADEPMPVASFAGRGIALVPTEALSARTEALCQSALREGRIRIVL
jgi:hypothetical protein